MNKVIVFSATWCAPCKVLKPILDKISKDCGDIEFVHVDIDKESALASAAGIMAVPTIIFEKDGVVKNTLVGLVSERSILDAIEKLK